MTGARSSHEAEVEGTARRFVGLAVPDTWREPLRAVARAATDAGLRPTDPDGWHVTCAFLGEVPASRLADLQAAVRRGLDDGPPQLRCHLDGVGRFGGAGARGSGALWVGVGSRPSDALDQVASAVRAALADAGFTTGALPFRGHVTVARGHRRRAVDDGHVARARAALDGALAGSPAPGRGGHGDVTGVQPGAAWTPGALAVFRAVDRAGPARYEVEALVARSRADGVRDTGAGSG